MTALTTSELARTRKLIGDYVPDTRSEAFEVSDDDIQDIWSEQDGSDSEQNAYRAYYKMLELRLGLALNSVDTATETGGSSQRQKYLNIKERMAQFRELAGDMAFVLGSTAGVMDFGIDENEPSES